MRTRWHVAPLLAVTLVLMLGQTVAAQEPGPTPTIEAPNSSPDTNIPQDQPSLPLHNPAGPLTAETLTVPFRLGVAGVMTAIKYRGQVAVTVSGVGQAAGSQWSDAFYIYTDGNGNPITPWHPTEYYNWTLWINGGPADYLVNPIPPYSPHHLYIFNLTVPGGPLTFAVGDTLTDDNTGEYRVIIRPKATNR
jgi:hypothetical protein